MVSKVVTVVTAAVLNIILLRMLLGQANFGITDSPLYHGISLIIGVS